MLRQATTYVTALIATSPPQGRPTQTAPQKVLRKRIWKALQQQGQRPRARQSTPFTYSPSTTTTPEAFLRSRLARFFSSPDEYVITALRHVKIATALKLPSIIAGVLKTWCNGWCTSRRFVEARKDCLYGCGCHQGDSLEHYLVCPLVAQCHALAAPTLPPPTTTSPPELLLGLVANVPRDIVKARFILLYTTFLTYEQLRANNTTSPPPPLPLASLRAPSPLASAPFPPPPPPLAARPPSVRQFLGNFRLLRQRHPAVLAVFNAL